MPSRNEKPKKKQPKVDQASRLFEIFAGSYVNIITSQVQNTEDGAVVLQVKGYFLDVCSDYVYIGESPVEVAAAVRRSGITAIMIDSGDIPDTGDMQ